MLYKRILAILAITSFAGVVSAEPSPYIIKDTEHKKEALSDYIYQERALTEIRRQLRKLERDKAIDESFAESEGIPADVVILQRKNTDKRLKANNQSLYNATCKMETIEYDVNNPTPIEINVARNSPAHIIFYDFTGEVWPIVGHAQGNTAAFNSNIVEAASHTYEINVVSPFALATNNLLLKGLASPLVLKIEGNEEDYYCSLSIRLSSAGPNASFDPISVSTESLGGNMDDPMMLKVLRREIPSSADPRYISGVMNSGEAWVINDYLYIRTRHWIESPPRAQIEDVNGTYVYRINDPNQSTAWIRMPNGEVVGVTISDIEG